MSNWTEGRLKAFLTSVIRSGFRKYPAKYECLNSAKRGKKINPATGRLAEHYECNKCHKEFVAKDVQVDHIKPIVDPKIGFTTWDDFIKNLYCGVDNLQTLCKSCHSEKTAKERIIREEAAKKSSRKDKRKP